MNISTDSYELKTAVTNNDTPEKKVTNNDTPEKKERKKRLVKSLT